MMMIVIIMIIILIIYERVWDFELQKDDRTLTRIADQSPLKIKERNLLDTG